MIDKIRKIFRQPLQLSNLTPDENRRIVSKALKALNCTGEWQEEKDAATVRFDFQSGHFGISISSRHPQVELSFLFFAEADMNDINIVRQVCNQSNLNSDGPRFTYTVNEKTNVIDLHILTMLLLDEDRAKDILSSAMVDAFAWQNSFIRHLGEVKREAGNAGTNDLEKAVKDFSRSIFLLHEQELSHQQTAPGWRHNDKEPATLEQWMDRAFGRVDVIFSELTVVADGITVISDREAIAAYNLSDALIAGGASEGHARPDVFPSVPSCDTPPYDFQPPAGRQLRRHSLLSGRCDATAPAGSFEPSVAYKGDAGGVAFGFAGIRPPQHKAAAG